MQIICVSRGSYGYGKQLAEKLAIKLGYACISREMLTDQATAHGIPVGKIEMAVVKRRPFDEALAIQVDRFKAFITKALCEEAASQGVVYHGRTGHLILPGLSQVLRIRAIEDMETRIDFAMQRMNLSREKARQYIEQVDDDIRRWVRMLYNVDWEDPALYDATINSARVSVENSASALVQMAQLPEFQPTPASRHLMDDLLLSARCRLAVGEDERTGDINVTVRASRGAVSVTYLPWQQKQAEVLPSVLEKVAGVKSLVCTVATTNILYIQERFAPDSEPFQHLVEVAEKWNAAVNLMRLVPAAENGDRPALPNPEKARFETTARDKGGILDDSPEEIGPDDANSGLEEALQRLIQIGRAGATRTVYGGQQDLAVSLSRTEKYSLIVVGEVFLSRAENLRTRMKRELISYLADQFRVPVISSEELKKQYLFGAKQLAGMALYALLAFLIYYFVFAFQVPIFRFLSQTGTQNRIIASAIIAIFVPITAFIVGNVAGNLLKMVKLE